LPTSTSSSNHRRHVPQGGIYLGQKICTGQPEQSPAYRGSLGRERQRALPTFRFRLAFGKFAERRLQIPATTLQATKQGGNVPIGRRMERVFAARMVYARTFQHAALAA
jgi:hypothetical protein